MSAQQPAPTRPKRPAKPQFTQATLMLEAFLVGFATLVAYGLRVAPPATVWTLGGVTCVVLILLSGYVGKPGGYVAGSVAQLAVLAFGVLVPLMFVVGGVFVVLWVVALRLGGRIDRERAEWDAAHPDGPTPA
ncbi:DUF4233 domain-containing protein [Cellulomonas sp. S1-8]|uniref:DUF4233 domain-containing protein n=1 Tax=Cellulomonas sp. S1-8 TaxID=2904790 RepID=UPI002242ED7B|nr:DUF4233 domain-containing protein [Cellulomonas sp. S1-8]UZN04819.1 DUF4233 domain-containing protein [Cellulomonas sp. S1-8]